ncbi:MAG: GTP cyclohydrolase I FolE [Bacteroidetes bacterium]|nr:GTP cyclohydrolase I FolE [Bacteroidota bacterium]MBU1578099.1 GTP cyclohydrolase I FolE [Bacteroidota bacterium]MBU2464724.1 GTP cyclohydrolase I FolE [Bacteroidota bacterium]MBU2557596.1 GTP cyclohydrolase I FolE [Bacteroidota bacterium]
MKIEGSLTAYRSFNGLNGHGNGKATLNGNGNSHIHYTKLEDEQLGDEHAATSRETPLRADAFLLSDESKITTIESHFEQIMTTLGLDLTDDSLRGTPHRVAKMFVKEIFHGLNPANKPRMSVFDNKFRYGQMLVEKNITLKTTCEHHFLPIFGKAHVAYISSGTVIGLSKMNRIVDYFARRPQVQERLTVQVAEELKKVLNTEDVAVVIDAKHLCVASRGIQDDSSTTITAEYGGAFKNDPRVRDEFLKHIG